MTLLVGNNTPTTGGKMTAGGPGASFLVWYGGGYVAIHSGTATTLNAYVAFQGAATGLELAIYDNASPPNLLASGTTTLTGTGLFTVSISSTAITSGQTYHLAWQSTGAGAGLVDDNTGFHGQESTQTYGSPPATLPAGTNINIGIATIYADGTITGGGGSGQNFNGAEAMMGMGS